MTIAQNLHPVRLQPPFYQKSGDACALHRYLDPDFVNRFRQDIQQARLDNATADWLNEERHSPHGSEPVLRLPLHRAFHLVCCEAICGRLGEPALDPARITSAGFVIRRVGGGRQQGWMLEDGEALGWQDLPSEQRDPDLNRRLCARGILHRGPDQPAYSGEEIHPLHLLHAHRPRADGTQRPHTLLFGYVPLGGFHFHRDPYQALDTASRDQVTDAADRALPWPFGHRTPDPGTWNRSLTEPVVQGRPTLALFELLRLLVNRYHLGEPGHDSNQPLARFCAGLHFYDVPRLPPGLRELTFDEYNQGLFAGYRQTSLHQYLRDCFTQGEQNPLVRWIILQEQRIDAGGGLDRFSGTLQRLPTPDGTGTLSDSLFLLAGDAQELRNLLGQRLHSQTLALTREIPLPKFTQNPDDLYQIVPFVRTRTEAGCEQLCWADTGSRSLLFRVAAPFDPEASRPAVIQMPSLRDLRRGLAKGAAMITPGDTFDLMNRLKLNKGVHPDALPEGDSGPGLGIQWICSFSLPVITLVAMILLMIMISLLNIVFFWMPWVRICLPFPKLK